MCLCVCLHARALVDFHVRLNSCSLFLLSIALNSIWFYFADVKSVFCPNCWSEEHVSKRHMSAHLSVQCLWGVKLRDFLFSTRENKEHPLNNLIKLYFASWTLTWSEQSVAVCVCVCVFILLENYINKEEVNEINSNVPRKGTISQLNTTEETIFKRTHPVNHRAETIKRLQSCIHAAELWK